MERRYGPVLPSLCYNSGRVGSERGSASRLRTDSLSPRCALPKIAMRRKTREERRGEEGACALTAGVMFSSLEEAEHIWQEKVHPFSSVLAGLFFAATVGFEIPIADFWKGEVVVHALALTAGTFGKVGRNHLLGGEIAAENVDSWVRVTRMGPPVHTDCQRACW